ncbi:MAG: M20 family peptidase [Planctomycetota bacterium]|nr:MAG: M20 family peptidase [Planctomycetota bacterium]
MGRDVSGPEYLEGRLSDYLTQRFTAAGIPWARQPVSPGRDNVLARLEATQEGAPVVLWDAHQDTVPVDGMTIEPFVPLVRNGRLQGRGACDVKGGMAAMLVGLDRLQSLGRPRPVTVVFSATVNEEFGFSGARALARLWRREGDAPATDEAAQGLLQAAPLAAIVAEPTGLDIVGTHKGAVRWRIRIHGRACHSSFPERGSNAIYHAAGAVLAIERLAAELLSRTPDHPCGPPTLSLGTIHGGTGVNLVPDLVVLELDRRLVPGESSRAARDEVIRRIADACPEATIEHDEPFVEHPGLPEGGVAVRLGGRRLAERLVEAVERLGRRSTIRAARYGTNASVFAAAGVPTMVFGPGSIDQAHTADEWIEIAQVDLAADALVAAVT